MKQNEYQKQEPQEQPIVSLTSFCRAAGISTVTAWRFRKRGWLKTCNIAGRQYCTAEAIAEFKRRAEAGEFSKNHVVPVREAVAA